MEFYIFLKVKYEYFDNFNEMKNALIHLISKNYFIKYFIFYQITKNLYLIPFFKK